MFRLFFPQRVGRWHRFLLLCMAGLVASPAVAQEFAVENQIFSGKEPQPLEQTTTVFQGPRAYDLVHSSGQAAVFDPVEGRIVLLKPRPREQEPAGGVKTEIPLVQLDRLVLGLKQQLARSSDRRLRQLARVQPQFSAGAESWRLRAGWLEYQVKPLAAPDAQTALRYYDFVRWSTRLAALRSPTMLVRLELNRYLEQRKQLPREITLRIYRSGGSKAAQQVEKTFRSRHRYRWQLRPQDRELAARIQQQLASFRSISWQEFRRLEHR